MRFFSILNEYHLFERYAEALDWLLSEGKFEKSIWDNGNKVKAFTKAIYKLNRFSKEHFHYDAKKNIQFPTKGTYKQYNVPTIFMSRGESEGRDLIRHLRNGIAHGNVDVFFLNNEPILELLDFGKEDNQKGSQTAYYVIPLHYIIDLSNIYFQKEKQWRKKIVKR